MKKFLSSLLFVCLFALSVCAQTDPAVFDQAYWLSQPPALNALVKISDQSARATQAATLAIQGYTVDTPIDVWGWDAYLVMKLRQDFGYTWVPSLLQPPPGVVPGGTPPPGVTAYDPTRPPAGSIKVSTNIADYPPFAPPPVPAPLIQTADYVGAQNIANIYYALAGDPTPDGAVVKDSRGTFIKHKVQTPFGFNTYYEKQ